MFGSNYKENMAKILGDVMKPGNHGHSFWSALRFALWFKAFASEEQDDRAITKEASGEGGSESDERECVEL